MSIFKRLRRKNQDNSPSHDPNESGVPEEEGDVPQGQGYQPPTNMVLQHYSATEQPPAGPPPPGAPTLFAGLQLSPATTIVVQVSEQPSTNQPDNGLISGFGANSETQLDGGGGGSAFSFLSSGSDSRGGAVAGEKEEESATQGSVFSFMNVEQTSDTHVSHKENIAMQTNNKEETSQSAFSFLQGPSEGQEDQEEVGLSAAQGDPDAEKRASLEGALNGDSALVGEPSGSAFSFLRKAASEEESNQAAPSLLHSFEGTDTSLRSATLSEPDAGIKRKDPVPGQPHVSSTPAATPTVTHPKTTGRGASIRNFLGFGRNAKKQNSAQAETPEHTTSNPPPPPTTSIQDVAELTTPPAREEPVEPVKQAGRDEVPRPSQQEGGEQYQGGATPLPATLSALLMGDGAPTTTPTGTPSAIPTATPTAAFTTKKWALPAKGSVSTPAVAMDAPGKAAPSPSQQPLTPTKSVVAPPTTTSKAPSSVGRQLPPAGKKKKRKAVRPGQGWDEEDAGSLEGGGGPKEADTHSLGSESSTTEGRGVTDEARGAADEGKGATDEGRGPTDLSDEAASEVAGSQQLVEIEPVTKETLQVTPPISKAQTDDQERRVPETGGHRGEEAVRAPQKKETIPSGLRAAYQLDKVVTPPISLIDEEHARGEGPDHHSRGSLEVPPGGSGMGKATPGGGLTGAEKLSAAVQSSEGELSKVRSDQKYVQQKYTEILEGHLAAIKKRIQTRLHIEDLKAKEAQALADENYELADELSRELDSVAHSQEWTTASAFQTAIKEWIESWSKLISTEVSLQKTLEANLSVIKEDQSKVLVVLEREFSHQFSRDKMKLKNLEDKVERERGHVALDREHLEKSEALLKEDLDNQCSHFVAEKQKLLAQREEVLSEIAALEAKLRGLREQERSIADAIETEQEKIEGVRRELSGEQAHLAEQKAELDKREAELKKDEVALSKMKVAYEASTEKKEAEKRGVLASIQTIEAIRTEGGSRTAGLQKYLEESGTLVRGDTGAILKPSPQLQSLQEKYLAREKLLKDAASQVFQLQSGISSLKNKLADTERQLPALEEAKKAAVTARQFKEAARISSEIKQLGTDIEEYKSKRAEKEAQLSASRKEQESSEQGIASMKAELDTLQRAEDLAHIKDLVKISDMLKDRIERCSLSPSLLCVLKYWSLLHELLAQDLCAKHGLNISNFKSSKIEVEKVLTPPTQDAATPMATQSDATDVGDSQVLHTEAKLEEGTSGELLVDTSADSTVIQALNEKIEDVEAQIAQACEAENFELAAQLEEQLQELKKSLQTTARH